MKRRCKTCKWYEEFMGVCFTLDEIIGGAE